MRDASDGIRADAQNALDNPPKTKAGNRQILMTEEVKAASILKSYRNCAEKMKQHKQEWEQMLTDEEKGVGD